MTIVVEAVNLTKTFNGFRAVDDVSMTVESGQILGVAGSNGAGKTTLLRLLSGAYWPNTGFVRAFGNPLSRDASSVRQRVQLFDAVGESSPKMSIKDLVRFASLAYARFDDARCRRLMQALELPSTGPVSSLSLGMRAQLRLAISLSTRPDVLLLDEPTNGLDPIVKRQFLQFILREASDEGAAVVIATHHLDDLDRIADSVLIMYEGRKVVDGMLDDLKSRIQDVQAILPAGLPSGILGRSDVIRHDERGSLHIFTVSGEPQELSHLLRNAGASYVETVALPLDEIFRYVMEREGYTRGGLENVL